MYINTRTNQLMANPSIRNSPLADLYISPQEYDPGAPMKLGKQIPMQRGQSVRVGPAIIRFDDLRMDQSGGADGKTVAIAANLTVTPDGQPAQTQSLRYVAHMDGSAPNQGEPQAVAGFPRSSMTIENVVPVQGQLLLSVAGLTPDFVPPTPETLSVDVTRKPLIALVWGGFYVMMAGALLAFLKRSREARAAVATATAASAADARAPRTGSRPLPATAHATVET
jgi:hypothetical protein